MDVRLEYMLRSMDVRLEYMLRSMDIRVELTFNAQINGCKGRIDFKALAIAAISLVPI